MLWRCVTVVAISVGLCLTGCTIYPEKPVSAWPAATGGEHFERLFWDDVKNRRLAELEPRLGSTFVATVPAGVQDRARFLAYLKTLQLSDYSITDLTTEPAGQDIVVTYTITLRGSQAGQPLPLTPMTMMTVWQQVKRGYIAISHSEVPKTAP